MRSIVLGRRFLMFVVVLIVPIVLQLSGFAEKLDEVPDHSLVGQKGQLEETQEQEEIKEDTEEIEEQAKNTNPKEILMNNTDLYPTSPQSDDLGEYLEDVMLDVVEDDMSTFDKVKSSYDYLVNNLSYGSHISRLGTPIGSVTCADISRQYGPIEGYGAVALTSKTGMCNAYASAFILMAKDIGLDARLAKGSTRSAGGGYAYHEWAEIVIDGVPYVFDPQLEQNLTAAGLGTYNVFFKTYDQIPGRYAKI